MKNWFVSDEDAGRARKILKRLGRYHNSVFCQPVDVVSKPVCALEDTAEEEEDDEEEYEEEDE
ncbi:MAG: hypothetical protein JKY65_23185 [Planctomycetes bacterium]|nr:hypothetical protein [Planctomycetota bacterium]